uniref:Uncharacterized protein n=1 Tax=Rhizophagus irregularis (strain DAOM 181602 / DAOM 197198 / MUCL 43194) TaxID=747089 RepID=U9UVP8_RHIID
MKLWDKDLSGRRDNTGNDRPDKTKFNKFSFSEIKKKPLYNTQTYYAFKRGYQFPMCDITDLFTLWGVNILKENIENMDFQENNWTRFTNLKKLQIIGKNLPVLVIFMFSLSLKRQNL